MKKNQPLSPWNSYPWFLVISFLVLFLYFFILIFLLLSFTLFRNLYLGSSEIQFFLTFIGSLVASFLAWLIFYKDLSKPHFNNELTSFWRALFPEEEIQRDFNKDPCGSIIAYPLVFIFILITLPAYYIILNAPFKAPDTKIAPPTEPAVTKTLAPPNAAIIAPPELVDQEKRKLFSSVAYQVQDVIFEQSTTGLLVRLIPYLGSISEITVEFPQNRIVMNGCLKHQDLSNVSFELKIEEKQKQYSGDPWQHITLVGEEMIIKEIKLRSEIAERLLSLSPIHVLVDSPNQGDICIQLTCNETDEAIKRAYLLIIDLQSFFESKTNSYSF
ncbi:MAG: hypothetical protein ACFFB5_15445 [Promethearchaeota archaeon]